MKTGLRLIQVSAQWQREGARRGKVGVHNCWSIALNDLWSKKIYRPKIIVDVWCYIHLRWSCSKTPALSTQSSFGIFTLFSWRKKMDWNFCKLQSNQCEEKELSFLRSWFPWDPVTHTVHNRPQIVYTRSVFCVFSKIIFFLVCMIQ